MLTSFKLENVNFKEFDDSFPTSSNVQTINTTIDKRQKPNGRKAQYKNAL